jgi:hypothetical protein
VCIESNKGRTGGPKEVKNALLSLSGGLRLFESHLRCSGGNSEGARLQKSGIEGYLGANNGSEVIIEVIKGS